MLSNKTKGEKRKMFLLLWIVIGFGYYHVRFTGGIGTDLINEFVVVSDPSSDINEVKAKAKKIESERKK